MKLFNAILHRELLLSYRNRTQLLQPLLFFLIVMTLFPLAISSEQILLRAIAPGIVWMAALLATLLSLEQIFRQDFEDGSLEQFILNNQSLLIVVSAKIFCHWLTLSLPLIILASLLGLFFHLSVHSIFILILSLLLGTPSLCLIGGIAAALTVGLKQGGVLLALIVLPLYVPVLIFGADAINISLTNAAINTALFLLAAFFVLALTLAPFAIAGALRASVNNF